MPCRFRLVGTAASILWVASVTADQSGPVDAADKHSARYAATIAVDANLAGKDTGLYTTTDHTASKYIRNTNVWAASYDLTCVPVYNSYGMELSTNACCPWEAATRRAGTLVSPRHLVFAHHYPIPNGTQLRFVDRNNAVVTLTMTDSVTITGADLQIGVLNTDVPPGQISFARVLPANYTNYFPSSLNGIPAMCFNKVPQAVVSDIGAVLPTPTNATVIAYAVPTNAERKRLYSDKISGDSGQPAFIILNGQLVILNVWTGGGPGTGNFIASYTDPINAAMKKLGGGYRLTPVDLSGYTRY